MAGQRCTSRGRRFLVRAKPLKRRLIQAHRPVVYRREFLLAYRDLPVGPLERAERLDSCALENGQKIRVVETEYESLGVDTPED
jgi:CMP-2-keto-3-deoxyoctulosonic acid synthetase